MSGTLVLDCEGLSGLVRRTPELTEWLVAAEAEDIRVVTSSVTLPKPATPGPTGLASTTPSPA